MNLLMFFYAFIASLAASLMMVPFLRRWAIVKGSVDVPDERKVHEIPTPRLGGVAIFLAFLFAIFIFAPQSAALRGILAGALVVFATGIADDLHGLTSKQKFIGQIVATLVTIVASNLWLQNLGNPLGFGPIVLPPWAGIPFTVFAVVGVTNAINLIDGLDGLAGGVSVLALTAYALLGIMNDDPMAVLLAAALAGAILGFLKYNFFPARIFMGDAGSLTVGFLLGFIAVMLTQGDAVHINVLSPVLVLALPVADAVWVMIHRLSRKQSPFAADRTHVHHKFLDLGFEHRFTVVIIYTLSLFWACSALLLHESPEYVLLVFLIVTAVCFYLVLRHLLDHRERYPFLQRDAEGSIRNSGLFLRCAQLTDRAMPLLLPLVGLYLLFATGLALRDGFPWWPAALLLGVAGLVLRLRAGEGSDFQLLLVYACVCLATFSLGNFDDPIVLGLSARQFGDGLLLVAALLAGAKLLFRRPGEFSLGSADFLALALVIFLAITSQQPGLFPVDIDALLLRAPFLMLAAHTVASRGPTSRRFLVNASLVVLAVFTVAGMV